MNKQSTLEEKIANRLHELVYKDNAIAVADVELFDQAKAIIQAVRKHDRERLLKKINDDLFTMQISDAKYSQRYIIEKEKIREIIREVLAD